MCNIGNDRRSDVLDASERKYIRWNCVAHLRTSRLSRASQIRILSVEGCARYDDYRASWTWLIPTTRRRRGCPPLVVLSTASMQIFSCTAPTRYNSPLFTDTVENQYSTYRMSLIGSSMHAVRIKSALYRRIKIFKCFILYMCIYFALGFYDMIR